MTGSPSAQARDRAAMAKRSGLAGLERAEKIM